MAESEQRVPAGAQRTLATAGSVYVTGRALQLGATIVVVPVLLRALEPAQYGVLAAAILVHQVLNVIAAAGVPTAIALEMFNGTGGVERARRLQAWTVILAVGAVAVADLTGDVWIRMFDSIRYDGPVRVLVLASVPLAVVASSLSMLQARGRAVSYVSLSLASTVGAQVCGVFGIVAFGPSLENYAYGYLISATVAAVAATTLTPPRLAGMMDGDLVAASARLATPTVPNDLALFALAVGDRVVIERVLGVSDVGRYQVAYAVGILGVSFVGAVATGWLPLVYGAVAEDRWSVLARTGETVLMTAALTAGMLAIAAPVVLRVLAPPAYDPAALADVAAWVSAAAIPYVGVQAFTLVVIQLRRSAALTVVTPISAAFGLLLTALLVARIGLVGAGIGTVVAYSLQATLMHGVVRRRAHVPWGRRARLAVLVGLSLVGLGLTLPATGGWLVARATLASTLAATIVRGALFLRRQDADTIRAAGGAS